MDKPGDFSTPIDVTSATRHSEFTKQVELPEAQHQRNMRGNPNNAKAQRGTQESLCGRNPPEGAEFSGTTQPTVWNRPWTIPRLRFVTMRNPGMVLTFFPTAARHSDERAGNTANSAARCEREQHDCQVQVHDPPLGRLTRLTKG